jgi:glycosyltransferase involved in cell wall biosynthesis
VQNPSITLIVSTYNRPDFLRLVLDGIATQQDHNFELMLADDGSTDETSSCIETFCKQNAIQTQHIWHEDEGFRKSVILNKAIAASKNQYIVFLDGDCIPLQNFIKHHRSLARKNRIVGCSRILFDQTITRHLLDNDLKPHEWSFYEFLKLRISGHLNRIVPLIPLHLGLLRSRARRKWQHVRGCNFGIYKDDLIAIGGFDESFTGWGYEDSELAARAINNGCFVRKGDNKATVLHLWHPEVSRDEAASNKSNLVSTLDTGRKIAISSSIISS